MPEIVILCVEDEPDVLDAVVRELEPMEDVFPVEAAADASEARELLEKIDREGNRAGLIFCDHIMPGEKGVDLLTDLQRDERWTHTRKVLLTGQAGLEATVKAVNEADLAHYIAKPWEENELVEVAREQLTLYVKERDLDPMPYLSRLDPELLGDHLRKHLFADR